jgi:CRP/FNR family transcriptional regulator, cyclic AMP receptor protein
MQWPLLEELPDDVRRELLEQVRRRRFDRRQAVFHEGDPSDGMHIVQSGWVAVRLTTPLGDVATSAVVGPGEPLGEQSLVEEGGRRSTSAVTLTAVETLYLSRDTFAGLRARFPSMDRYLVALFDERLRRLSARLVEALYVPAPTRVMRRIADLATTFGPERAIPLTQEDVASLAGTTRPTVNRIIGQAEKAGALRVARGSLFVVDMDLLTKLACSRGEKAGRIWA